MPIVRGGIGEQGPKGEQGEQGPKGDKGDTGAGLQSIGLTAGTSRTETGNFANDVLAIMVKGDWTGSTSAQTITLTVAGASADVVGVRQAATSDKLPWCLLATYVCPNANDVVISVAASGGTLANVKIMVIKRRP